jgi:hypothetical protein
LRLIDLILAKAPNVRFFAWETEKFATHSQRPEWKRILSHRSLSSVALDQSDFRTVFDLEDFAKTERNWWPNLLYMKTGNSLSFEGHGHHDAIRTISVEERDDRWSGNYVGTSPSAQITGLLSKRLAGKISRNCSLSRIELRRWLADPSDEELLWPSPIPGGGIRFNVFESQDRLLVYGRFQYGSQQNRRLLLRPHRVTYDHGEITVSSMGEGYESAEDERGMWVDLTNFDGCPLPRCLLNYVIAAHGQQLDWENGARRLDLPQEVWGLLEHWRDEVETVRFSPLQADVEGDWLFNDPADD